MHRLWILIFSLSAFWAGSAHGQVAGADYAVLKTRILDERGEVMAGTNFKLELVGSRTDGQVITVNRHTDEHGRIQWKLKRNFRADTKRSVRIIRASSNNNKKRAVRVDLSRVFAEGEHDLGDLVLHELPVLASGVIHGADGVAMRGVEITVLAQQEAENPEQQLLWKSRRHLKTSTDTYGRFEVRDFACAEQYRFSFRADGFVPLQEDLPPGSVDLKFFMKRSSVFYGRLLVDAEIDPRQIEVIMVPAGEPVPRWKPSHRVEVAHDGNFQMPHLRKGTYLLIVRTLELRTELLRLEAVVVCDFTEEPEIQQIDLRGLLKMLEVNVVAEGGEELESVTFQSLDSGSFRSLAGHQANLLAPNSGLNLAISALGQRYEICRSVQANLLVKMRPAIPVQIVLEGIGNVPDGYDFHLHIYCTWTDAESGCEFGDYYGLDYDVDGVAMLLVRQPGLFQVDAGLSYATPGAMCGSGWSVGKDGDWTFVVEEQKAEQVFRLDMAQPLLDAMESWRAYDRKRQSQ